MGKMRYVAGSTLAFLLGLGELYAHEFSGAHGTVEIDWTMPNISRVLSSGYGDSFGTEAWTRKGLPNPVKAGEHQCLEGSYFLFDIDDDYAFDIDETVEIEFIFDRTRSQGFHISYDQNGTAENIQEIDFPETAQTWHSQTVKLKRARFANRGESGSDFTLTAPDGTWFGDPDADHKIVICEIRISRSNETRPATETGKFQLVIRDETSQPTPARVGLYDASDRMPLPSDSAVSIQNYEDKTRQIFLRDSHGTIPPWPSINRYFFYVDGSYTAELPAGQYELVVSKGLEYRRELRKIEIRAGETLAVEVRLPRWIDMPALGWYSSDDHVHMTRTPADNEPISAIMRAEDVHVTNLLQMGNPHDTHFKQYAFGEAGRYRSGHHALVPGVEDPRTAVRGHTISLNIKEVVRPADRYLQYDRIFAEYRNQGGLSGFAHVAGRLFNVERGLAIDVPLGAVDLIEVLQDGVLETGVWYDFLNLGFSLIPTAGSDFPYLNAPGGERNYVYVGDDFIVDAFFHALAAQHTFVSNGPFLDFSVNGQPMGSQITLTPGESIEIQASASLNPDIEKLARLELIVHGEVLKASDKVSADNTLSLSHSLQVDHGIWLAIRAQGANQTVAHSAPIYITTGGGFENPALLDEIASRMISKLEEFRTVEADEELELEAWSVGPSLEAMLKDQRREILKRAEEARSVYEDLLKR